MKRSLSRFHFGDQDVDAPDCLGVIDRARQIPQSRNPLVDVDALVTHGPCRIRRWISYQFKHRDRPMFRPLSIPPGPCPPPFPLSNGNHFRSSPFPDPAGRFTARRRQTPTSPRLLQPGLFLG